MLKKSHFTSIFTWLLDWQISKNVGILYLDISKAFDKVSHNMPVNKMEKCGLYPSKRMLPDRQVSTHRKDSSGMPQSSHFDLVLHNIVITDLQRNEASIPNESTDDSYGSETMRVLCTAELEFDYISTG